MNLEISRRDLLLGLGATAVLAACGGSSAKRGATKPSPKQPAWAALSSSSDLYRSDAPQRFAFVVTHDGRLSGGPGAQIGFAAPGTTQTEAVVVPTYRGEGLETGRGVYVVDATLPIAGTWNAGIRLDNGQQLVLPFNVSAQPTAPVAGTTAPSAVSPTIDRPLGVNPICTRRPVCPLHDRSTDTIIGVGIIGVGRPAVVMFATPARCQTSYCGPVLDLLVDVVPEFQDRVDFAHVEIYRDSVSEDLSPTVEAWGLVTEPWLFTLDGTGRILKRLDGAFDRGEIREALAQATA